MKTLEELLKPCAPEQPCGKDISYDPAFQELDGLIQGKPESVMGDKVIPAEPPDWKTLRERCEKLWAGSKDLRVAADLTLAELNLNGVPGFRDGLALIKALVEQYWDTVYPLLDPTDNNDPTQRVNIISAVAMPVGTYQDPMRFLERLREAPLTNSRQFGRISTADMLLSESGEPAPDGQTVLSKSQIEAAFRDTPKEELEALNGAFKEAISLAEGIDDALTKVLGAGQAPNLELLPKELAAIQARLAPYLPAGAVPTAAAGGSAPATAAAGPAGQAITGDIQSRADVVRMIDKICDYYKRSEPSSPVPHLLGRAKRLVDKNFMEIIGDLNPEAVKEIQRITGETPKEGGGSAA